MSKQKLEWRTECRKVKDLVPYKDNPRTLSATQLEGLKRSLLKMGSATFFWPPYRAQHLLN